MGAFAQDQNLERIQSLPPDCKSVFSAVAYDSLSFPKISQEMKISEGEVRKKALAIYEHFGVAGRIELRRLIAPPVSLDTTHPGYQRLSERQKEIVRLKVIEGLSHRKISERLQMKVISLKMVFQTIYEKVGASSELELLIMLAPVEP